MKKFTRIFLSREEKRQITDGDAWDSVIEEIQKTYKLPPLLERDAASDFNKKKWILLQLCARQEWKCFWCGCLMTDGGVNAPSYRTLEHVVPKAAKGKNVHKLSNLRAACAECNQGRSVWSRNKSLTLTVDNQRKQIGKLTEENLEVYSILANRCAWCRFRFWARKIFKKESS